MKLYRHYKQKPYRLLGTVRHSETLEEMTLYEARYPNDLGNLWVRPQEMFRGSLANSEGQRVDRFTKIDLEIIEKTKVSEEDVSQIRVVYEKAFGEPWDENSFQATFRLQDQFLLTLGKVEGVLVGFKLGFPVSAAEFYSWLGAVLPEFRGLGIASDLMKSQHDECRELGYQTVRSKTMNKYKEMLILNIRNGFRVVGTEASHRADGIKIILEKSLTE